MTMPISPRRTQAFSSTVLIILHLALTLPLAGSLNIWADEASTLYATRDGLMTAFYTAATEQKQAPLYFWIVSVWRYASESIFFARLFSVICSCIAIKVFADLCGRLFEKRTALLTSAFFALSPFLIWASLEIRVYSLVILLSLVALRRFVEIFLMPVEAEPSWQQLGLLLFSLIVSLYTNYYLGFLIAGLFGAVLLLRRPKHIVQFTVILLVAGIAFLPMLFAAQAEFAAKTGGFQEPRSLMVGVRGLWSHFLTFTLPAEIFPGDEPSTFSIVRVWFARAVVLVTLIGTFIFRRQIQLRTAVLGTIAGIILIFLLAAYFLVGSAYIEIRHAAVLFMPLILFAASLLADISANWRESVTRPVIAVSGFIVLASFSYSVLSLFPGGVKRGDWGRVAEFIEVNEKPDQPIMVFTSFDALSLLPHYKGVNRVLPDEGYFTYGLEGPPGSAESLMSETDFFISEIPRNADQIWLAVNEKCLGGDACRPLQNYLEANYTVAIEKDFYLERLYLLNRKHE